MYQVAFFVLDAHQLAVDAALHGHGINGRYRAKAGKIYTDIAVAGISPRLLVQQPPPAPPLPFFEAELGDWVVLVLDQTKYRPMPSTKITASQTSQRLRAGFAAFGRARTAGAGFTGGRGVETVSCSSVSGVSVGVLGLSGICFGELFYFLLSELGPQPQRPEAEVYQQLGRRIYRRCFRPPYGRGIYD